MQENSWRTKGVPGRTIKRLILVGLIGLMLICVDIQYAFNQPYFNNSGKEISPENLLQQVAEQIDPKRPYSLRELVEELLNVTPMGTPDTDLDGLPDPVEAIIGTDYNSTDTDLDQLDDYFEVFHDSDPLEPDTNFDGFPDKNEFNVSIADIDQDGVPNVWDPDNDGDGVNDVVDLSPFAKSIACNSFHLDIEKENGPLYIDFQFRPSNEEHLTLVSQYWDWPHDEEGLMRDYDNSDEDVFTQPILKIQTNHLPNQSQVEEYGITVSTDCMYVPVLPVWDKDDIVALKAKIFFPSSSPTNLSLDMSFQWRILGETDNEVLTLSTLADESLAMTWDGLFTINETESSPIEFTFVEISDELVALRLGTGQYVSVNDSSLVAGGFTIGEKETFTIRHFTDNSITLQAYSSEYVSILPDGYLGLGVEAAPADIFNIASIDYESETILLVSYPDRFFCTGFVVEEFSSSDLGLFYSSNVNQTIAANMLLSAEFLRNNTNHIDTVHSILVSSGITVSNPVWQFSHRDEALIEMSNTLIPNVLDALPENQNIPLILATEEVSKVIEMSETSPETYLFSASCSIDLISEPSANIKSLKTNFYNTSSYDALSFQDIMLDMNEWGLDNNASIALTSLIMVWNGGEQVISGEGKYAVDFAPPDSSVGSTASAVAASLITVGIIVSAKLSSQMSSSFRALSVSIGKVSNFIQLLKQGWALSDAFHAVKGIQSAYKAGDAAPKFWSKFDTGLAIIGILIDVGFSIYAGVAIASAIGGRLGVEIGATYGTVSAVLSIIVGVVIWAIGLWNPIMGVLLGITYALGAIFGNWIGELSRVLTEAFVGPPHVTCEVTPYYDIVSTDVDIQDWNNLGFDVGDRIDFTAEIVAGLNATGEHFWSVDRSYNKAWLTTILPLGSFSTDSSVHTQQYPIPAGGLSDVYSGYTVQFDPAGWYYVENTCTSTLSVSPGTAMANFPLNVRFNHYSRLNTLWYHRPFWLFGERCYHYDTSYISNTSAFTTLYFDVFPSSIDGFMHWSTITPLDHDADGLRDTEEPSHRIWNYDTDSDGLSDKFEVENGLDPDVFDTDADGLSDEWEYHYGTNATNVDSDGDGLRDYREIAGWEVTFTYNNTPFTIHVFSDPRDAHSDNDGIDDYWEYWSNTNPRSSDTNGDGTQDEIRKMAQTEIYSEWGWTFSPGSSDIEVKQVAVDDHGDVYMLNQHDNSLGDTPHWSVMKTNSTLSHVTTGSYFDTLQGGYFDSHALATYSPRSQNHSEYVYTTYCQYIDPADIYVLDMHNLTGTYRYTTPNTIGVYMHDVTAMDISPERERMYLLEEAGEGPVTNIEEAQWSLSSGTWYGTDSWSIPHHFEPSVGTLGTGADIAYSSRYDRVYVTFPDRVLCFDPNGVDAPFIFGTDHVSLCGIDIDEDGFVYVLDAGSQNKSITVYDYNGEKFPFFGDNGTIKLQPYNPFTVDVKDIAIGKNGDLYVAQTSSIYPQVKRFVMNQTAVSDMLPDDEDSDFDQLTNLEEKTGWEISITFSNGSQSFNVTSNPLTNDTDKDTLSDYDEWLLGTNPNMPDSDGDSVRDDVEIQEGLDPTHFDSDGDTLPDGLERTYGSNPKSGDTDGEGVPDDIEFSLGSNANSSDSDGDGLNDNDEYGFNSSLLSPDADNDFMFDSMENSTGTNPNSGDNDLDGVKDGLELLYGTDPRSNDTDQDGLIDGIEIDLWLNPLSADTDNDGLSDLEELELSTNPWCADSDYDGIPDGVDEDSFMNQYLNVTLVVAPGADNNTLEFVDRLREFCHLNVVTYNEFMDDYTDSRYIVLVGRPDAEIEDVRSLIYSLLEDTGDVLTSMTLPDAHEMVVRYGIWDDTQTVVMLSRAISFDVYSVLSVLRGSNVTVFTDGIQIDYNVAHSEHYQLNVTTLSLGSIDIVKQIDATLSITLSSQQVPSIVLKKYTAATSPNILSSSSGLIAGEEALGRYLEVFLTVDGESITSVAEALIIMYYKHADLDRNENGLFNDPEDLNESTLVLYLYDEDAASWIRLSAELDWVIATGVNTTDIMVYGEVYAGYVWARVTHLSLFGVAGQTFVIPFPWIEILILSSVVGIVGIGSAVVVRRRRGRKSQGEKTSKESRE